MLRLPWFSQFSACWSLCGPREKTKSARTSSTASSSMVQKSNFPFDETRQPSPPTRRATLECREACQIPRVITVVLNQDDGSEMSLETTTVDSRSPTPHPSFEGQAYPTAHDVHYLYKASENMEWPSDEDGPERDTTFEFWTKGSMQKQNIKQNGKMGSTSGRASGTLRSKKTTKSHRFM